MASDEDAVLLGYIDGPLAEKKQLDIRQSRLGGHPVWSKELPSKSESYECKLCKQPMALLAQISAAYGDRPKRLLYVFACSSGSCGCDPQSWKVLRSVGDLSAAEEDVVDYSSGGATSSGAGYPSKSSDKDKDISSLTSQLGSTSLDDWGVPAASSGAGDDWGVSTSADDDWGAGGAFSTDADSEIQALLEARNSSESSKKTEKPSQAAKSSKATTSPPEDESHWQGVQSSSSTADPWPCIRLTVDYEPYDEAGTDAAGDHEQELLKRYLESEFAGDQAEQLMATGTLPKEMEAEAANLQSEMAADKTSPAEVNYGEEDDDDDDEEENIRASGGAGGTALGWLRRFQKRLGRSPEQVIRYAWNGAPLWLQAPPKEILAKKWPPCCSACGASRIFELQLMPTLLAQMQKLVKADDAAKWNMDWGAVVIYTCSADCQSEDPSEEFLVVQQGI
eukprot:TRINITY_DN2271_c0_g1_i1.p1 TRINITY_DN2271_c0_g1~~TRINITY_DN2271_c0_g1_i1.p1  ORF type:complete len:450 (-),score=125.93 TRINITY_DN2271_c0_g1_i1:16-1365(-)